jgi:predicted phage-related endonuclease
MRANEFWNRNVKEDVAPEIQNESDLRMVYPPEATHGSVLITEDIKKKMAKANQLDSLISRLGKQSKDLKSEAKIAIGSAETVHDGEGNVLYTFTYRKGKTTVDSAKLKKEYPEIYEDCIKVGNPYRALSKKKGNDEQ